MPSRADSSFAYRASQFALRNKSLLFCNCTKPYVEYSPRRGPTGGGVRYCYVCKGLISDSRLEDILALQSQQDGEN